MYWREGEGFREPSCVDTSRVWPARIDSSSSVSSFLIFHNNPPSLIGDGSRCAAASACRAFSLSLVRIAKAFVALILYKDALENKIQACSNSAIAG